MPLIKLRRGGAIRIVAALLFASASMAQSSPEATTAPWERVARLPGGSVDSVVFDTAHPGVAFAGSDAAVIYRSVDGGASWKAINVGTVSEGFRAIAVNPAAPGIVYAYSTDNSFSGLGTLYRSIDDGRTWRRMPSQPSSAVAGGFFPGLGRGIVIDPTGKILVLTDAFSGVLRSADGGTTWTNPVPNAHTYGLAADPAHRGVLWSAGADNVSGLGAIWKSTDFGATWAVQTPDAFNPPPAVSSGAFAYAIAVQPGTGLIVANWSGRDPNSFRLNGGMVLSADGGNTWTDQNAGLLASYNPGNASASIAFDPTHAGTIYLSTDGVAALNGGGVYRSRNSGHTWEPIGTALRTLGAFGIWVRPDMRGYPAALFAGEPDLFVSTNHAESWERADRGQDSGTPLGVGDDDFAPGGYYAASGADLFHSTNGGESWSRINTWNGPDGVGSVAVDRKSPFHTIYAPSWDRVWRSTDAGGSWHDVTPPAPSGTVFGIMVANPRRADDVFALASDGTLFHSRNGGIRWTSVVCGSGIGAGDGPSSSTVVVSGGARADLYIPFVSGLWVASADGSSCVPSAVQPLPGGYIVSIAEMGTNPTSLLVSGYPADGPPAVMRSSDGGATYQAIASLPGDPNLAPWELTSSPDLRVGVAVFNADTIAVSRDGGANWTTQPDTLFDVSTGFAYVFGARGKVFWGDISGALYAAPYDALE